MTLHAWLLLGITLAALLLAAVPLGRYLADLVDGRSNLALRIGGRAESALYRLCGVDPRAEMDWLRYALAILLFNLLGALAVYALQRLQVWLPLNPEHLADVSPDSAFNTAISFATNTNWQGYAGESTMSPLTQMLGLAVQNFFSAATGIAVVFALIRGFARHTATTLGNAWVDLTRVTLYVLLPLSLVMAIFLVGQGVVQGFSPYQEVSPLDAAPPRAPAQTLPMGPAASQIAIKQLGTNGGGLFNANSAHPYENPTPLSNFVQTLAILLIPAALCITFGRLVGDPRQGWVMLAAMTLLFVAATLPAMVAEQAGNPLVAQLGVESSGGNLEGKEMRFDSAESALWASATTAASNGSVNSMHDSYMPVGGLVALWNMMLGEVVFGGVGSGLYGMLLFAVMAVFLAGLMIGRTPEYLGKKIEAYDIQMVSIAILLPPLLVLLGTALAVMVPAGVAGLANPGPHGFSEILYAFTSAANNNGSAFAGLSANTPFYNILLGLVMWLGRFGVIVPVLALAGHLAAKKRIAPSAGTLPTHGPLFVVLLMGTVVLVGALSYVPVLALGPVVEQLMLQSAH